MPPDIIDWAGRRVIQLNEGGVFQGTTGGPMLDQLMGVLAVGGNISSLGSGETKVVEITGPALGQVETFTESPKASIRFTGPLPNLIELGRVEVTQESLEAQLVTLGVDAQTVTLALNQWFGEG
ncbi:hypothetical protein A2160_04165 [Candidatus Beckwithbacteria bacterium RBG_13_42_9]|uniref:Uncharacterized protein n=1 Tax=Candidatus Beckwithbacteria bacterium RBG_13_42_9 TaxID=1797457 RepID=A0A1F5E6P1_9BACT|nr:MAG: hypothetical protein A2160_04165 [Candidatus Beckwithbacteria bacterium RBG_13_42_9]